ncbi:hypothetical protein QZH41_017889 [Actinostola sp. cb2023]|nr:hypothetical protein QZH41_017889 [Actinostola sp. cb2023]
MSRQITSPPCPVPAAVLRRGALSQNQNEQPDLADLEVQYFCTADTTGKSALGTSPWRCTFDDDKTALPVLNQTSKICSNVVLNVTYRFDTFEQKISKVRVTVTLGNVRLPAQSSATIATSESPVNTITQYFITTFLNTSNASSSATVTRSGNPGYIRGLPLLAVTSSGSDSTLTQLLVRSPSGDGLCTSSSTTPILYGETSSTGCLLKLGIDDMRNCTRVRELVRANQEALLKATHVGRTGNARATTNEDWLPIIRETIKDPPTTSNTTFTGVCPDIPYGLLVHVLVAEAGRYKGVAQMEVVGLKISYKYTTWQFQCVSGYGLSCLATPNKGINVTQTINLVTPNATIAPSVTVSVSTPVNVSSVVQSNDSTIAPSVTVSVSPSVNSSSVVKSNDSTPNKSNQSSDSYSPRQMYFVLESSVVFIDVPATEPAKVKRSLDQSGICYEDVCKEELFYPLSPAYQGEPKDKVMAYFLLLLFLALVTFSFTRPWG